MIHSISIENFFSIAEKQVINFRVPRNAPHVENFVASRGDETIRLPLVAGFFGANASGKSTVLRAMDSVLQLILESAENKLPTLHYLFQAYRNNEWLGKPTKISVELDGSFSKDGKSEEHSPTVFKYEVHIANTAGLRDDKFVLYEALSYQIEGKSRRLFMRDNSDLNRPIYHFGRDFHISANDRRLEILSKETSIIGRFAIFNHEFSKAILEQLSGIVSNIVGHQKLPPSESAALNLYKNDPISLGELNRELSRFDLGLESFSVEVVNGQLLASSRHLGLDFNILLHEESQGTRNFINMFPMFYFTLQNGGILIIDELDADLHPLLIPELLRWFYDPIRNPYKAQLLFSAHNVSLLDELEKEQVFFTEKPMGNATRIYGAKDIGGLRREPSLTKKYLSGELGAVPQIG